MTRSGSASPGACRRCTIRSFGRAISVDLRNAPAMSLRRWSDGRRRRPLRAVRATVFLRALSCSARARISPGNGRALRRRSALRPSPAPASKARCLTATLGDVLGNALAGRRLERQANTLSCSSSISFYFSPTHFPPPDMLRLAGFSVSWRVSCKRPRIHSTMHDRALCRY